MGEQKETPFGRQFTDQREYYRNGEAKVENKVTDGLARGKLETSVSWSEKKGRRRRNGVAFLVVLE